MGYTIKIGNATPYHHKEHFPTLSAGWEVETIFIHDAPIFPNDPAENSNTRWPAYTVWSDFCINTGLHDFFYDETGCLRGGHPGCIGITQYAVDLVSAALDRYREKAILPPGFEPIDSFFDEFDMASNYDYDLARLIWLDWWMKWAIKNCETPAIQNY